MLASGDLLDGTPLDDLLDASLEVLWGGLTGRASAEVS